MRSYICLFSCDMSLVHALTQTEILFTQTLVTNNITKLQMRRSNKIDLAVSLQHVHKSICCELLLEALKKNKNFSANNIGFYGEV